MNGGAEALIAALGLQPHVEGGHYQRIHTAAAAAGERPPLSIIQFLLRAGEYSAWHQVDAEEVWHYAAGEPLELLVYHPDQDRLRRWRLGPDDPASGQASLQVVPAYAWQAARPLGAYTFCHCAVAPAFDFSGFRLLDGAPPELVARLAAWAPDLVSAARPR